MVKLSGTGSISTKDLKFSIEQPVVEKAELTSEEAEMYSQIFDEEIGPPIEVREDLKDCLSVFSSIGLLEDRRYPGFIELCHQALKQDYDSVEKKSLHVINNNTDAELILADKKSGSWEFVATVEKDLIKKFYKNKNLKGFATGYELRNSQTGNQSNVSITSNSSKDIDKISWLSCDED